MGIQPPLFCTPPASATSGMHGVAAFEVEAPALRSDRTFVLEAMALNGRCLCLADGGLNTVGPMRGDRDVVLAAVAQKYEAFRYASPTLKSDHQFVLSALRANGLVL